MRISAIEVFPLRAKLEEPFSFSQWTFDSRETTLVRVQTDEALDGWGEAYGPSRPNAAAIGDYLGPMILGRDPRDTEAIWAFLFARGIDQGQKGVVTAAISAIDIALWDIKAKAAGVPLHRLLGAEATESIPCYVTGFYFDADRRKSLLAKFQREARVYVEEGFGAVKMKVGLGVERDAELVAAVRDAIGPGIKLMIDANHAYDARAAIDLGRRVEQYDITWFEEPVSPLDIEAYLEVKRNLTIPLAGGECESTRFGFEPWLRRHAFDYAQPDLCACGGISEGMKIATLASVHGIHLTPHVWGTAVGQAAALHFYAARPRHPSTVTGEVKLIECDRTESPFRDAVVKQPLRLENGRWHVPDGPGLGIEIDRAAVEHFTRPEG
jgi:D-galactarolactone cycloisomerase